MDLVTMLVGFSMDQDAARILADLAGDCAAGGQHDFTGWHDFDDHDGTVACVKCGETATVTGVIGKGDEGQ